MHKEKSCLQDAYGRVIDTLRLSVTDLCNERCIYCMPACGVPKRAHADMLSLEELGEIATAAVDCGITKIRLTGGEPLVRKGFAALCQSLGALPKLRELCLTTNGTLLPPMAKALHEAGLSRVNLSLDSLKPERYAAITRRGTLQEALKGLESALNAGFTQVKLNMVLMGGVNDDEILDFIALTKDHPIEVRFLELMPMGECASWPLERFVSADEVLKRCPALEPLGLSGVAQRYRLAGHLGTVGLIRPMSGCFCDTCSRIRVTADGMLKPCLHASLEKPLRGLHGEALLAAIREGVQCKPRAHLLSQGSSSAQRLMNEIGG
ncbi:MAG: GTP 3',8-cyclase MoaA [Clostridia bacterium]